jgi:hypothetical protein
MSNILTKRLPYVTLFVVLGLAIWAWRWGHHLESLADSGPELTACQDHHDCQRGELCFCDEAARLLLAEEIDQSGYVDSRRTLIYDDRGRLTRVEWSSGRVAIMERASNYEYDNFDRRLRRTTVGPDDTPNRVQLHQYRGMTTAQVMERHVSGVNTRLYGYDDNDHRVTVEHDREGDGVFEEHRTHDEPCPPPYRRCANARMTNEVPSRRGLRRPSRRGNRSGTHSPPVRDPFQDF